MTLTERAAAILRDARNVFVLTGAGMSAESGVPTFRGGGGAAVWRGMPFTTLSSAEMVKADLPLVWEWFDYRRSVLADCRPNAGHIALARAEMSGRYDSFKLVTQNIDNLHYEAGSRNVIELHGNIHEARCKSCRSLKRLEGSDPALRPPICPSCSSQMRPNVVLFGEMLIQEVVRDAFTAAEECDACLVIGTSALVSPANALPSIASRRGAELIEINPEETQLSAIADISIRRTSASVLGSIL